MNASGEVCYRAVWASKALEKSLGLEQSGSGEVGDVIFVPTLPARVSLDGDIIDRGKSVTGGEPVVRALPATPAFTLPVTEAQSAMIPTGTAVQLTSPQGNVWDAVAGSRVSDAQSQTVLVTLTAAEGETICRDQCSEISVTGKTLLPSRVITVPTTTGLVVPSSALLTDASGQIALVDQAGTRIPVSVTASAKGMSIVEGIGAGEKVRVPAQEGTLK